MRRARWQHAARYYNDERATYRRAIRILESKLGKKDPQLIVPLSKLAESFYYIDLSQSVPQSQGLVSTGEVYFKRAVKIAEANPLCADILRITGVDEQIEVYSDVTAAIGSFAG